MTRSLLHKKTIGISVVIFSLFILVTQPLYRILLSVMQPNSLVVKPAFQIYRTLATNRHPTRTLLVFANHAEQRIGGGFVGSVGVLEGFDNKFKIESVRSVYYYDHRLEDKKAFIRAPDYLHNLAANIYMRDALLDTRSDNNTRVFRDLYARETGEYIDNVVIITPKVLALLLQFTGPIHLSEYNLTVTSDNILSTLQQEVESGQDKVAGKDPKTVLKVLANDLVAKMPELTLGQLMQLSDDMIGLMQTQQLYVSLHDQSAMQQLSQYQEPIKYPGSQDTIQIASANHAANKSSQAIRQFVEATIYIAKDGASQLSLKVSRQHTSDYSGRYIDPRSNLENFIIGDDLSWLQVTLPKATQVQEGGSFVGHNQPGVFGVDLSTKPLTTSVASSDFILPTRYAMLEEVTISKALLAQFGWFGQHVKFRVEMPEGYVFKNGSSGVVGSGRVAEREFFQIDDEALQFIFKKQ